MIEIYKTDDNRHLNNIEEMTKGSWVNIVAPTEAEIDYICSTLKLPINFMKDPLDDEERPRIEKEDDNVLIIVDFPYLTRMKPTYRFLKRFP